MSSLIDSRQEEDHVLVSANARGEHNSLSTSIDSDSDTTKSNIL